MPDPTPCGTATRDIFFNIIGGLLTIPITWLSARAYKTWRRHRFKRVFGWGVTSYYLAYGSMTVNPSLLAFVPPAFENLKTFPLMKKSKPEMIFSAENAASACEIRAAAYVAATLGKEGGILSEFVSDEALSHKLDIDFISFGAMSNLKTLDAFVNEANDLAEYNPKVGFFVSKRTQTPLCIPEEGFDYGIILKIHPREFPQRTWIACAGWGEWGTSGSAWFLARKWKELESAAPGHGQFVCIVQVTRGQDESAKALGVYRNPGELPGVNRSANSTK